MERAKPKAAPIKCREASRATGTKILIERLARQMVASGRFHDTAAATRFVKERQKEWESWDESDEQNMNP